MNKDDVEIGIEWFGKMEERAKRVTLLAFEWLQPFDYINYQFDAVSVTIAYLDENIDIKKVSFPLRYMWMNDQEIVEELECKYRENERKRISLQIEQMESKIKSLRAVSYTLKDSEDDLAKLKAELESLE